MVADDERPQQLTAASLAEEEEWLEPASKQDEQYMETLGKANPRRARAIVSHPVLRVFARWQRAEEERPRARGSGVRVSFEKREREHIAASLTRRALRVALRLHDKHRFRDVVAVDGSYDPKAAVRGQHSEEPECATAWGSWDGRFFRGGALPPDGGNHVAELVAIERTLRRVVEDAEAGAEATAPAEASPPRVLILSDCQGALMAMEGAWRARRAGPCGHDEREALRKSSAGTVIEAIVELRRRIHARQGVAVFMYTPAHKGGVSANAYADAAAKAHLSDEPEELPMEVRSRMCIYALRGWKLPADKPVYRMMHALMMARVAKPPGAAAGSLEARQAIAARNGVQQPWVAVMARRAPNDRAGRAAKLSQAGLNAAARFGIVGTCNESHTAPCKLCAAMAKESALGDGADAEAAQKAADAVPAADLFHRLCGECVALSPEERRHGKAEALAQLRALETASAPAPAGADEQSASSGRRALPLAQPVEAGADEFTFARVHAGQCRSDKLMQVEEGSPEDRMITPWLARAMEQAARLLSLTGERGHEEVLRALAYVKTAFGEDGMPHVEDTDQGGGYGIVAVHALMGQLQPLAEGAPRWASEAAAAARAKGETGLVRISRMCVQRQGTQAGQVRCEAVAVAPDGSAFKVTPPQVWQHVTRYLVVIKCPGGEGNDNDMFRVVLLKPESGREAVRVQMGQEYQTFGAAYNADTLLPEAAGGQRCSRLLGAATAFAYAKAKADVSIGERGWRALFSVNQWPGAPAREEEPLAAQLAAARQGLEAALSRPLTSVARAAAGSSLVAILGGVLERPSAGVQKAARVRLEQQLQAEKADAQAGRREEEAHEAMVEEDGEECLGHMEAGGLASEYAPPAPPPPPPLPRPLKFTVAGSNRGERDAGPGSGALCQSIVGREGGVLCNPFPMGEGGVDERRRELSLQLYRRWLAADGTPAGEMRMLPDEKGMHGNATLPLDMRPSREQGGWKGREVRARLRELLEEARREKATAVRLEGDVVSRGGAMCHGEYLAEVLREMHAGGEEVEAVGRALAVMAAARGKPPATLAEEVAEPLAKLKGALWGMVHARERAAARAAEAKAAAAGLTVVEQRVRLAKAQQAERQAALQARVAKQVETMRAAGKRKRGEPRAAAPRARLPVEAAMARAQQGDISGLQQGWVVEVPRVLWGGGSKQQCVAHIERLWETGEGVWLAPVGRLGPRAVTWADLRGETTWGAHGMACRLVTLEDAEDAHAADEAEVLHERREAAAAARAAAAEVRAETRRQSNRQDEIVLLDAAAALEAEEREARADGEASGAEGDGEDDVEEMADAAGPPRKRVATRAQMVADTVLGAEAMQRLIALTGAAEPQRVARPALPPMMALDDPELPELHSAEDLEARAAVTAAVAVVAAKQAARGSAAAEEAAGGVAAVEEGADEQAGEGADSAADSAGGAMATAVATVATASGVDVGDGEMREGMDDAVLGGAAGGAASASGEGEQAGAAATAGGGGGRKRSREQAAASQHGARTAAGEEQRHSSKKSRKQAKRQAVAEAQKREAAKAADEAARDADEGAPEG